MRGSPGSCVYEWDLSTRNWLFCLNTLPTFLETPEVTHWWFLGPIHMHRTRMRAQIQRKSFDVACLQCGHSNSHQQVPFACVARVRPVWMRPWPDDQQKRRKVTWRQPSLYSSPHLDLDLGMFLVWVSSPGCFMVNTLSPSPLKGLWMYRNHKSPTNQAADAKNL